MENCRKFKVTLVSAENLPEGRSSGKMNVYAKLSLNGDPNTTLKTDVDMEGKSNPTWNFTADYTIKESTIEEKGVDLIVHLYRKRSFGHRFIGEVKICVKSLYDMSVKCENVASYCITGTCITGTPNGRLNISYGFGDKILVRKTSVMEKVANYGLMAAGIGLGIDPRIDC